MGEPEIGWQEAYQITYRKWRKAADEIERLHERLGPLGLETVTIQDRGHYVNKKVKAEIERLRKALEFYATHENYWAKLSASGLNNNWIACDGGAKARSALKEQSNTHHPMEEDGDMLGGKRDE